METDSVWVIKRPTEYKIVETLFRWAGTYGTVSSDKLDQAYRVLYTDIESPRTLIKGEMRRDPEWKVSVLDKSALEEIMRNLALEEAEKRANFRQVLFAGLKD